MRNYQYIRTKKRNPVVREDWVRKHPDSLYTQYRFACDECDRAWEIPFCHEKPMEYQRLEENLDAKYQVLCNILSKISKRTGEPFQPPEKAELTRPRIERGSQYHLVCRECYATWEIPVCCGKPMELQRRKEELRSFTGSFNW